MLNFRNEFFMKNFFYMLNNGISLVFSLLFWLLMARFISTEIVGISSSLILILTYFVFLGKFGFDIAILRFNRENYKNLLVYSLKFTTISSLILIVIWYILIIINIINFKSYDKDFILGNVIILVFCVINLDYFSLLENYLISQSQIKWLFLKNILSNITKLLVPIILKFYIESISILSGWGLSLFIVNIIIYYWFFSNYEWKNKVKLNKKVIFKYSLINYISGIISGFIAFIVPILSLIKFGSYLNAFILIPWNLYLGVLYLISTLSASIIAREKFDLELLYQIIKLYIFLIFPGIILLYLLSPFVMFLYGNQYQIHSVIVLQIFLIGFVGHTILQTISSYFQLKGHLKSLVAINLVWFLVFFALIGTYSFNALTDIPMLWTVSVFLVLFILIVYYVLRFIINPKYTSFSGINKIFKNG